MNDNVNLDLRKALDLANTNSKGGPNLIPEVVSEGLREFVNYLSPLWSTLNHFSWPTNTYTYRSVTAAPTAAFTAEGLVTSASEATYAKPTASMVYVTTKGGVTGPMRAAATDPINAWNEEIAQHAKQLIRHVERKLIAGNATTSSGAEFNGMIIQTSLNVDADEKVLVLSHIDEALDKPQETPDLSIWSKPHGRRLWALLQAQQRFVNETTIGAGFTVPSYNGVPILRLDNTAGADLGDVILFPNTEYVKIPVLQDMEFELLGKTADSDEFFIKMYLTLAMEGASMYHSKIVDVKATA